MELFTLSINTKDYPLDVNDIWYIKNALLEQLKREQKKALGTPDRYSKVIDKLNDIEKRGK